MPAVINEDGNKKPVNAPPAVSGADPKTAKELLGWLLPDGDLESPTGLKGGKNPTLSDFPPCPGPEEDSFNSSPTGITTTAANRDKHARGKCVILKPSLRIYRCKPETKQDSDIDGVTIPYIASESEYTYHAPTPGNNSKYAPNVVIRAYMYHFTRFCYETRVVLDTYEFVVEDWGIGGTQGAAYPDPQGTGLDFPLACSQVWKSIGILRLMSLSHRKPVDGVHGGTMEVFNGWSAQRREGRAMEGGQTDGPNPERDHRKLGLPLGQDKEILGYYTSTLAHIHCPSVSNPVPTPVEPKKPGTKTPPDSGGGGTPTPRDAGGRAVPTPRDWISATERGPDTLGPGMVRD